MIRRAVGDAERRGGAVVDAVGDPRERRGGHHDLLGERAVQPVPVTRSPTAKPSVAVTGLDDHAGELAARARTAAAR